MRRCSPARARREAMSVDVVTFGCRLNAAESEVIRREAERAGFERYGGGQYLRRHRRSGAAGAANHPGAAPRTAAGENRRHRLRGADRAADFRRHARDRSAFSAIRRNSTPRRGYDARAAFDVGDAPKALVNDIMAVKETARAFDRRLFRPRPRLRSGAKRLRPPLHLLHHSVRPRQFALGADGRGGRRRAASGRQRLWRSRADRRRHHELWRRTCRARRSSARWSSKSSSTCPNSSGCGCRRSIRSRPTAI